MKLLVIVILCFGLVAAQTLTDEQKAKWKKWSDDCQAESGVSQETINKLRSNQFDGVVDDKLKAHSLCFGKKSGLIDANGSINVDLVRSKLKKLAENEEVEKIIEKCVVEYDTPQEAAYEVFKCLKQKQPKFSPV